MGLGQTRGIAQVPNTELVRNLGARINQAGDELAAMIPYVGSSDGACDGSGNATITHNLGFTPSRMFVQNRRALAGTNAWLVTQVDSITATTFRVKFMTNTGSGTTQTLAVAANLGYTIDWQAFR